MMKRKLLALALAGLLCLGFAPPAHAAVEELVSLRVDEVVAYSSQENIYTAGTVSTASTARTAVRCWSPTTPPWAPTAAGWPPSP